MAKAAKPDGLAEAAKPHYAGHRGRMRERLHRSGADGFTDAELLEVALHLVIPQKDTKALAKNLLAGYGGFSSVLAAPYEELRNFEGLGDIPPPASR